MLCQEKKGGKRLSSAVHFPTSPTWYNVLVMLLLGRSLVFGLMFVVYCIFMKVCIL